MNRRRFLIAAAAVIAAPRAEFDHGRILVAGREYALTDILAPMRRPARRAKKWKPAFREKARQNNSLIIGRDSEVAPDDLGGNDPGADFFAAAIQAIVREGAPSGGAPAEADRWGRLTGPVGWRTSSGRETTLQELLLSQGAARVFPQSADASFIARCFAAERAARDARLGNWRSGVWRIRDAARAERSDGFQIYEGAIRSANERKSRFFFNFGEDFRTDFTASVARGVFRRWREKPDFALLAGKRAEVRGYVEYINGPSIELRHEMQLRVF